MSMKSVARITAVWTSVLTAFLLPCVSVARPSLPEATPFGFGTSWNVATASSGAAVDSGIVGGLLNPAALVSSRNELLGEGQVFGNTSAKLGITAANLRWGAGTIGYLNRYKDVTMAFVYYPLESFESGYSYETNEVVMRSQYAAMSAIVAFPVAKRISAGLQIGNIRGTSNDGVLLSESDGDTSLAPHLMDIRIGTRITGDAWSMSIAYQAPPFGSMSIDRPVNVTNRRESQTYSYRGSWATAIGIGYRRPQVVYSLDGTIRELGFRRFGGNEIPGDGLQADLSGSLRWKTTDRLQMTIGLSARLLDPNQQKHLIFGIGGSYEPTPEITLIGGAGLLFGVGDGSSGTPLENVHPWVLRGGAIFHGD
ncbi:MAG: hypothetical protein V2A56_08960 [bacterium]